MNAARTAWSSWRRVPLEDRCELMRSAAERFAERRVELAAVMSYEIGKTRADSLAELDECGVILRLDADQMEESSGFTAALKAPVAGSRSEVVYAPYGVFGIVLPFNFPMALATAMVAAAVITGNTVVYKPSALTPASGQAWTEPFAEFLPPGVLNIVHGDLATGRALVDSSVDGLGFTGSPAVGLEMAQRLAQPPYIRPLIAEMGGKNPQHRHGCGRRCSCRRRGDGTLGLRTVWPEVCFLLPRDRYGRCARRLRRGPRQHSSTLRVGEPMDRGLHRSGDQTGFPGPLPRGDRGRRQGRRDRARGRHLGPRVLRPADRCQRSAQRRPTDPERSPSFHSSR